MTCLISRAHSISSNDSLFNLEINFLRNLFVKNGYPRRFFDRIKNKFVSKLNSNNSDNVPIDEVDRKFVFKIPYVGNPSLLFKRKLVKIFKKCNINIRTIFTSTKVGRYFSLKDRSDALLRSSVVYNFRCSGDPNVSYIGKTKRYLQKRITEHQKTGSAIHTHICNCDKCSNSETFFKSFDVLGKGNTDFELQILEAIEIISQRPTLNKQLANNGSTYILK